MKNTKCCKQKIFPQKSMNIMGYSKIIQWNINTNLMFILWAVKIINKYISCFTAYLTWTISASARENLRNKK